MHVESELWHVSGKMILFISVICYVKVRPVLVWQHCVVKAVTAGTCEHALNLLLYIPCWGWGGGWCAAKRVGAAHGECTMAGNMSGALLSLDGSITHPGKQEQHGPRMMEQWRQGEELARGRFWQSLWEPLVILRACSAGLDILGECSLTLFWLFGLCFQVNLALCSWSSIVKHFFTDGWWCKLPLLVKHMIKCLIPPREGSWWLFLQPLTSLLRTETMI